MTVPLHMGALHPVEQAMVLLVAFGPFVVLAVIVIIRRRSDDDDDDDDADSPSES